ncbi:ATP-binding cassette domain-containing protein [Methylocapsa sp. S129]|uniref:ATP-binding cassette domain-containing protein n=1 Tax=Methylocapsa sp. S129 TaxID=1641869 RepID=UPI00131D7E9D|nr:ATP-binding cassette domain-containing protein [Methylocapsa sp. S129]
MTGLHATTPSGPSRAPLLRTEGLTKRYGGIVAADAIDLTIGLGEICGVIGPNGAGKSTLIGLLGGALRASAGRIHFDGQDVTALADFERARLGIGRTYQIPRPFLDMSVEENLKVAQFSLSPFAAHTLIERECDEILEQTGLADVRRLPANALPLLRRKRLEVARALALKPKLLLLDEVGAGLIESELTELIALIKAVSGPNRSIVVIEHVIRVVKECCDHLVVLNFGKKFAEGSTTSVLSDESVAAVYLGTAHSPSPAAAVAAAPQSSGATPNPESAETVLALSEVFAGYGQAKVLNGVDMTVRKGEVVAILGANGAGKTTLANTISGAIKPTHGRISIAGEDIAGLSPHQIARRGIAHCMEGRRIFTPLSVEENLLIAARSVDRGEAARRLDEVYALFPILAERRASPGASMSGGQQQMLAIGRALMSKPMLVIFDEISLGLAPVMMDRLYEALLALKAGGLTMLLIEQDVERALALADRAHVLERGKFALSGSAGAIRSDARLRHLYLGEAE